MLTAPGRCASAKYAAPSASRSTGGELDWTRRDNSSREISFVTAVPLGSSSSSDSESGRPVSTLPRIEPTATAAQQVDQYAPLVEFGILGSLQVRSGDVLVDIRRGLP